LLLGLATMRTYVLVHGAWQGASTWEPVVERLRARGHRVFTPSLTGLGERSHLLTPDVSLSTHVDDVLGVLRFERLENIVLVGHSYGGMVITAVAEQEAARIQQLVYVDAFIPGDGDSAMKLFPQKFQDIFRDQAKTMGEGWRLPGVEKRLDLWGLKPGPEREFVRSKLCDFSIRCFEDTISLPRNLAKTFPRTYVACVAEGYPARPIFEPFSERAKSEGWGYHELPTGHDCHVERADEFTEILLRLA
jgi:pimeloyl-ACP methyl ester carboxylesterase